MRKYKTMALSWIIIKFHNPRSKVRIVNSKGLNYFSVWADSVYDVLFDRSKISDILWTARYFKRRQVAANLV